MIRVRIREVAAKRKIKTSYQLQKVTGWPPAMCARIFKGEWTRIDLKTLDTLCKDLSCTPNDILEFKR